MQSAPTELKRRIVPRWRSIKRTPTTELENYKGQTAIDESVVQELQRRVSEWNNGQSVEAAQELVWASSVFGLSDVTSKSLEEVSRREDLPQPILGAARELLGHRRDDDAEIGFDLDDENLLRNRIRIARRRIALAPHDPIQFVELARLYCQLGQNAQAKRSFRTAVGLAPASRFVLRAAARFLVHIQDYDEAIRILNRGNQNDPWVQATRISVLDLSDKVVRDARRARNVLDTDIHPKHLSELAASLATLDFKSGNVTRAKKLFRKGAIDPNDNVVAQLHWAAQNKIHEFKPELLERSLTFEARASYAKKEKKWKDTLVHCIDWIQDEPMSARPAILGSYVASEMLQDYDKSLKLCEAGLRANPLDFTLLNNAAFNYAAKGELGLAKKFLDRASVRVATNEERITFLATSGMIKIRQGQLEVGLADYNKSIELAVAEKLPLLAQLATIHYFSELALRGNFFSSDEIEGIFKVMEDKRIVDEARDVYLVRLKPFLIEPPIEESTTSPISFPHLLLE